MSQRRVKNEPRRGATIVLIAILIVVLVGMVAFAVDVGYMVLTRTQLQAAADSSAMAAASVMSEPPADIRAEAKEFAGMHVASAVKVGLKDADIEFGTWDASVRKFTPTASVGNAVRVTARRDGTQNGEAPTFFGRVFGRNSFASKASAVAMANPRDIDKFMGDNPDGEFYRGGYYWLDAALMQATQVEAENTMLFPVGIGLGTDYDFMDRMGRAGGSADASGQSPRGSGNPAEYEQRLTEIFEEIIKSPKVRLVQ